MAGLEMDTPRAMGGGGKKAEVTRTWNPPQVTSRDASEADYLHPPKPLVSMRKAAEKAGWSCEATYARGDIPATKIADGRLTHSYALRMTRGNQRAVACWESVAHDAPGGWHRSTGGLDLRDVTVTSWGSSVTVVELPGISWTFKLGAVRCAYVCSLSGRRDIGVTKMSSVELGKYLKADVLPLADGVPAAAIEALRLLA